MKRVLAAAIALGMVAIAIFIREGGSDEETTSTDPDAPPSEQPTEGRVLCATELRAACEALEADGVEVVVEDAGTTTDRLRDGDDPGATGWVVPAAALEVVDSRAPDVLDGRGELLGTGAIELAVAPARASALEQLCPAANRWRCLVAAAGRPWSELGGDPTWGTVRIGVPSTDTGTGMAAIGGLAEAYFGDADFAAQDLDALEFGDWLGGLAANTDPSDTDPLETLLTRPGAYSAVAAVQTGDARASVLDAEPAFASDVVLVGFTDGGDLPDAAPLRAALADDGWDEADGPTGPPRYKPGVLAALRARWQEVTG